MVFNSPTTLVILTRDHLIRATFAARSEARAAAPAVQMRERPESDDVASLVLAALELDRARPGRVFVLATDFWSQTIDVAATHVAGVPEDEISQLLNFEAEPISGISAFEADAAAIPLGESRGDRRYWLTQIQKSVREQIDEVVRTAGGRLAGLAHPGGLPTAIAHADDSGARIEFWPAATVRTVYAHGRLKNALIDGVSGTADWVEATKRWQEQCGPNTWVELLLPDHPPATTHQAESYLTLLDPGTRLHWLAAWRDALVSKRPSVPVLGPLPKRMTDRQRTMVSLALGAVAALLCLGHALWTESRTRKFSAERTQLETPIAQMAALKTRAASQEKEMKTVDERHAALAANVETVNHTLAAHRQRIAELLSALAATASPEWVLQKIDGDGQELVLSGTALHPGYADQLAEQLSDAFEPLQWAVDPPKQTDKNWTPTGGPWSFEIRVHDLQDTSKPPALKLSTPNNRITVVRAQSPD